MCCRYFRSVIGALVGGTAVMVAAPVVLPALGFTSAGITAGSTAAWMMSLHGGATPAIPGLVATLQSAGAGGAAGKAAVTAYAAYVVSGAGYAASANSRA